MANMARHFWQKQKGKIIHFSPFITFQIQLLQQCPQCQKQSSHRGQEGTQQKPKDIEFKMKMLKLTRIKID